MTTAVVIGLGTVSVVHLAAIEALDGIELVGTAGRDYRELLDRVRPDVAHICTPHDQHADVVIDCLERGVNVLVEKPLAHTVAEAERVVAAAAEHPELKVGVCLQNRYNLAVRAARDLIGRSAARGASATVLWHRDQAYYDAAPWRGEKKRSGGGVLINQAIHTLDLLEWLLGEVTDARGQAGHLGRTTTDVEDTAQAVLTHAGGATSVFFATTTNVTDSPVTVEIFTEDATLTIRGDLTIDRAGGRTEIVRERTHKTGKAYWGASHEALIADFHRTLHHPEPFWIGPQEGIRCLRLVHRIYEQ
ncbi:Gfo/Idh/MocA family oxidoreductase [Actinoplanes sp. NPDC051633]|uniref:Gfo/Idh/MocA family protein n=1 Tax=Actinoplanes sp. NPDC051633 TaxID=3155670 RepID=UPI0034434906